MEEALDLSSDRILNECMNTGYTTFRGRVEEYWLPTPFACFPFISPHVRDRVPSHFNWTLESVALFREVSVVEGMLSGVTQKHRRTVT